MATFLVRAKIAPFDSYLSLIDCSTLWRLQCEDTHSLKDLHHKSWFRALFKPMGPCRDLSWCLEVLSCKVRTGQCQKYFFKHVFYSKTNFPLTAASLYFWIILQTENFWIVLEQCDLSGLFWAPFIGGFLWAAFCVSVFQIKNQPPGSIRVRNREHSKPSDSATALWVSSRELVLQCVLAIF